MAVSFWFLSTSDGYVRLDREDIPKSYSLTLIAHPQVRYHLGSCAPVEGTNYTALTSKQALVKLDFEYFSLIFIGQVAKNLLAARKDKAVVEEWALKVRTKLSTLLDITSLLDEVISYEKAKAFEDGIAEQQSRVKKVLGL